jgi:hypothetical protein
MIDHHKHADAYDIGQDRGLGQGWWVMYARNVLVLVNTSKISTGEELGVMSCRNWESGLLDCEMGSKGLW